MRYIRIFLFSVLSFQLFGCAINSPGPRHKPVFVQPPSIEMSLDVKTPLVGVLRVSTDVPVRVVLAIKTPKKEWQISFAEFSTLHTLPVLGFRAGTVHDLRVVVETREGARTQWIDALGVQTAPLPEMFPQISVKSRPDQMEPGYTLFNVMPHGDNIKFGALTVVVDELGDVVWYTQRERFRDVRKLPDGNLLTMQGNVIEVLNMMGGLERKLVAIGPRDIRYSDEHVLTHAFHHESFAMNNGHLLVLGVEVRSFENYFTSESDVDAPRATVNVAGDIVIELDASGAIVKQWSMLDTLDPYRIGYGSLKPYWDKTLKMKTADWAHANAVIHDVRDDSLIISLRYQDAVIKIDRKSGDLKWILGVHDMWDKERFGKYLLMPLNDETFFYPFHQHSPEVTPEGNIMIYDNGSYRAMPFSDNKRVPHQAFSRAVEYKINETEMTVELVWQYGKDIDKPVYSGALGDADYLPEKSNVLITHGSQALQNGKQYAEVVEVTYSKPAQEVFAMHVFDKTADPENGWRVYRSERIRDLYPVGGNAGWAE